MRAVRHPLMLPARPSFLLGKGAFGARFSRIMRWALSSDRGRPRLLRHVPDTPSRVGDANSKWLPIVARLYGCERRGYARDSWASPSTNISSRAALPSWLAGAQMARSNG